MAVTSAGRAATTAHRLAQGRVSARVVADVLGLWRSLDPLRLVDPAWMGQVLTALARHRETSAELAASYYRDFRRAEVPAAAAFTPSAGLAGTSSPWRGRAVTSLRVTGTRLVARLILGGWDPARALDKAGPGVAAASSRHVLDAGREYVQTALRADPVARGWLRVTGADPCSFCAMLASRGATGKPVLYRSERSATTSSKTGEEYHDGCHCQAEPVFGPVVLPEASQRFAALWETSTEGLSGKAARNAFRRAYNAARRG
ncbi:hypothetical protein P3102_22565 [Amycolatopsis sp. QT-25]|uniref:VG15 protein n=1 Tax=Amycolatopsis sp. QT-25 TaxID=3034022 RepID=UPI0023ECCDD9|nr:hypothetical protein [Amycolatopsis sp. QT-25]WET76889.1 hypothetical protein P3102_22565 [Amycolatopsis sp. QT-25]